VDLDGKEWHTRRSGNSRPPADLAAARPREAGGVTAAVGVEAHRQTRRGEVRYIWYGGDRWPTTGGYTRRRQVQRRALISFSSLTSSLSLPMSAAAGAWEDVDLH
jgi:hypothetical protein